MGHQILAVGDFKDQQFLHQWLANILWRKLGDWLQYWFCLEKARSKKCLLL